MENKIPVNRETKRMFPAALLLEGRRCLVVGGGRVAARKAAKLAKAGADLTVVAPAIRERIRSLPGVRLVERPFEFTDLDRAFLVFAVTDDAALNRQIVERCREKGILCSAADASWPEGDLILPASFSEDGLTVAISTGGRSCRRSRLLRESLSRHVEFLQNVDLFILGADHNTASFQTLGQLKARRSEIEKILPCIQGVHEFMILDTCNRFEIICLLSRGQSYNIMINHQFIGLTPLAPLVTPLAEGREAFRRFAETAAGLQSQVFGETRIVAQIKEALRVAQENRWAGSFLQGWVDTTLCISKEIRREFETHIPSIEIEDLVFQWLENNKVGQASSLSTHAKPNCRRQAGSLSYIKNMLIIGRGEIGQGLAKKYPDAAQISGRDDKELRAQLPEAAVVICATGSPDFIVDQRHRALLRDDVVLIDLSLPHNIDPSLPGVVGLSELRGAAQPANAEELLAKVHKIMDAHTADYERLVNF